MRAENPCVGLTDVSKYGPWLDRFRSFHGSCTNCDSPDVRHREVDDIVAALRVGDPVLQIAREYGVTRQMVEAIDGAFPVPETRRRGAQSQPREKLHTDMIALRLSPELHGKIKRRVAKDPYREPRTVSAYIRLAIEERLNYDEELDGLPKARVG